MTARFADTTAVFEFHAGSSTARAEARSLLAERDRTATSEAVEREWKRIVVKAASALTVAAEQEPDLAAVLGSLAAGHGREAAQRVRALAMCIGTSDDLNRKEIAIRAQQLVRCDAASRLHTIAGEIRRTSECGLATATPTADPQGGFALKDTCRRREGICRHEARVEADLQQWRDATQALVASAVNGHRRMGHVAEQMADEPEMRTGRNCYAKTGDVQIALDCRPDEELVTTDRSFDELGRAIGFTVRRLPT